ncbi:helix-turn-helix domain-containing protein [uncultured Alistipes sp.]|uniref:helix-turn-helix domain-containing protein n=1 Tax=uncultured Alistipes sp. TaxID=538949 RepID=UPI00266B494B|nr:helix-turn-helix domain-containing protein [uncultured Alistipes sp.]
MLDNIYILTDTELCNRIAAKIKTVRLKQNMSQAELADKSGVSISTIKRMEDGEVKNIESLIRILRTLGKLDIFVPLVEEEQLSPNEYYELASKASKPKRKRKRASKGYTKENKEESEW